MQYMMQLMYGDQPGILQTELSDSDTSIVRPASTHKTPAAYDSSSEDGILSQRITKRREELGVFEKISQEHLS